MLIVARDAGAASALAPVARILITDNRVATVVIGFRHAEPVFFQQELPLWAVDDDREKPGAAESIIEEERPDLVLTGTSMKPKLDGAFWSHARERNIPTIALLDQWTNYAERFSDESGPYKHLPDMIAVMDETSRRTMIGKGCPAECLVVTGQPAFDDFARLNSQSELEVRALARRELDVPQEDALIVFASAPQAKYYGSDPSSSTFLGYVEEDSLLLVLESLRKLTDRITRRVQVIVKLHPLETRDRLAGRVNQNRDLGPRILRGFPPLKLIAASDVVTGMTSVLLLEAAILGRMAISVQPGRARPDEFIDHQHGLIERADDLNRLQLLLANAVEEPDSVWQERRLLAQARGFDGRAGRRVAELVYKRLGIAVNIQQ